MLDEKAAAPLLIAVDPAPLERPEVGDALLTKLARTDELFLVSFYRCSFCLSAFFFKCFNNIAM